MIALFERQRVLTRTEIRSRTEILFDNYCKVLNIEALTMADMVKKDILPAVAAYSAALANGIAEKKTVLADLPCDYETQTLRQLSALSSEIWESCGALEKKIAEAHAIAELPRQATYYKDTVLPAMQRLRAAADAAETLTAKDFWPYPTYSDLLFSIL